MTKLYVGNLSYSTTEAGLRQVFEEDGRTVTSVAIIIDRETGRSRGFAFVEMVDDAAGEKAVAELHEQEVDGRRLNIDKARPRENRGGGGGGGFRRRDRW